MARAKRRVVEREKRREVRHRKACYWRRSCHPSFSLGVRCPCLGPSETPRFPQLAIKPDCRALPRARNSHYEGAHEPFAPRRPAPPRHPVRPARAHGRAGRHPGHLRRIAQRRAGRPGRDRWGERLFRWPWQRASWSRRARCSPMPMSWRSQRTEPNIVIGIIPAEGTKSYGGRVIAYSPGNDLALVSYDPKANLPVATLYSGVSQDGQQVTAIGYPGSVDRAQGMSLQDIIHPMSPVRTTGNVSSGRASKQFDTILHTAPLSSGQQRRAAGRRMRASARHQQLRSPSRTAMTRNMASPSPTARSPASCDRPMSSRCVPSSRAARSPRSTPRRR